MIGWLGDFFYSNIGAIGDEAWQKRIMSGRKKGDPSKGILFEHRNVRLSDTNTKYLAIENPKLSDQIGTEEYTYNRIFKYELYSINERYNPNEYYSDNDRRGYATTTGLLKILQQNYPLPKIIDPIPNFEISQIDLSFIDNAQVYFKKQNKFSKDQAREILYKFHSYFGHLQYKRIEGNKTADDIFNHLVMCENMIKDNIGEVNYEYLFYNSNRAFEDRPVYLTQEYRNAFAINRYSVKEIQDVEEFREYVLKKVTGGIRRLNDTINAYNKLLTAKSYKDLENLRISSGLVKRFAQLRFSFDVVNTYIPPEIEAEIKNKERIRNRGLVQAFFEGDPNIYKYIKPYIANFNQLPPEVKSKAKVKQAKKANGKKIAFENNYKIHYENEPCYVRKSDNSLFLGDVTVDYIRNELKSRGLNTTVKKNYVTSAKQTISSWEIYPKPKKKFKRSSALDTWDYHIVVKDDIVVYAESEIKTYTCQDVDKAIQYFAVHFGKGKYNFQKVEPMKAAAPMETPTVQNDNVLEYKLSKHTKTGEDLHTVKMLVSFSRDNFLKLKQKAKSLKGYYSKYAKAFIFKSKSDAYSFIGETSSSSNKNDHMTKIVSINPKGYQEAVKVGSDRYILDLGFIKVRGNESFRYFVKNGKKIIQLDSFIYLKSDLLKTFENEDEWLKTEGALRKYAVEDTLKLDAENVDFEYLDAAVNLVDNDFPKEFDYLIKEISKKETLTADSLMFLNKKPAFNIENTNKANIEIFDNWIGGRYELSQSVKTKFFELMKLRWLKNALNVNIITFQTMLNTHKQLIDKLLNKDIKIESNEVKKVIKSDPPKVEVNSRKNQKFKSGSTYQHGWIGDSQLKTKLTIEKRTDSSVWIGGKRFKIYVDRDNNEYVYPQGRYSMSPIMYAYGIIESQDAKEIKVSPKIVKQPVTQVTEKVKPKKVTKPRTKNKVRGRKTIYKKSEIESLFKDTMTECNDGTISTSGSCNWHGGVKGKYQFTKGNFKECDYLGYQYANSVLVPLGEIKTREDVFQNRTTAFSSKSSKKIQEAVKNKVFKWELFDPIILWVDAAGELGTKNQIYVLSGHSRFAAFKVLAKEYTNFRKIPAKILKDITLEEAVDVALNSNTLATPETEVERSTYFARLRENGIDEKTIEKKLKNTEGANWKNIYAYSFLNPNGKAINMLSLMQESDDDSLNKARSIANWIGITRSVYPQLTNAHEDEMYDFLFGGAFDTYRRRNDWLDKVDDVVRRLSFMGEFDSSKPLNLRNLGGQSSVELEYNKQLSIQQKKVSEMQRDRNSKLKQLKNQGANQQEINRIISPIDDAIRYQQVKLQELIQQKSKVREAAKNQGNLFAGIGRVRYHKAFNMQNYMF